MNARYRRQRQLRSRRHRQGRWRGCGCHAYVVSVSVTGQTITAFCDPVWPVRQRRKIVDLPDISTVTEAMLKLAPVAHTAATYFRELRKVYDAEST